MSRRADARVQKLGLVNGVDAIKDEKDKPQLALVGWYRAPGSCICPFECDAQVKEVSEVVAAPTAYAKAGRAVTTETLAQVIREPTKYNSLSAQVEKAAAKHAQLTELMPPVETSIPEKVPYPVQCGAFCRRTRAQGAMVQFHIDVCSMPLQEEHEEEKEQ